MEGIPPMNLDNTNLEKADLELLIERDSPCAPLARRILEELEDEHKTSGRITTAVTAGG